MGSDTYDRTYIWARQASFTTAIFCRYQGSGGIPPIRPGGCRELGKRRFYSVPLFRAVLPGVLLLGVPCFRRTRL